MSLVGCVFQLVAVKLVTTLSPFAASTCSRLFFRRFRLLSGVVWAKGSTFLRIHKPFLVLRRRVICLENPGVRLAFLEGGRPTHRRRWPLSAAARFLPPFRPVLFDCFINIRASHAQVSPPQRKPPIGKTRESRPVTDSRFLRDNFFYFRKSDWSRRILCWFPIAKRFERSRRRPAETRRGPHT